MNCYLYEPNDIRPFVVSSDGVSVAMRKKGSIKTKYAKVASDYRSIETCYGEIKSKVPVIETHMSIIVYAIELREGVPLIMTSNNDSKILIRNDDGYFVPRLPVDIEPDDSIVLWDEDVDDWYLSDVVKIHEHELMLFPDAGWANGFRIMATGGAIINGVVLV